GMHGVPPAEIDIDAALVRALLEEQFPDLAQQPISPAESGWDNAMFRLGERLAVRLPRRAMALPFLEREQRWLPQLADALPVPVPRPLRIGKPGAGFPWPWSVVPWLPGRPAAEERLAPDQVLVLAGFLRAVHRPAPADAPENPFRSVPLAMRADALAERWQRLERDTSLITDEIRRTWREALDAPIDVAPSWIHGDLHPRNLLVHQGALSGVIDWGDMARGDRATDLATIWMTFEDP